LPGEGEAGIKREKRRQDVTENDSGDRRDVRRKNTIPLKEQIKESKKQTTSEKREDDPAGRKNSDKGTS